MMETGSGFTGPLTLLNQLPKLPRLAKLIVLRHRQLTAEEKIAQRVLVEDAMNSDTLRATLEVDAVILRPITMELLALALNHPESAGIEVVEVFRQDLKFREQIELESFWQGGHLGGAQFVEDDLEHFRFTNTSAVPGCQFP
jgi:hypothetical protein